MPLQPGVLDPSNWLGNADLTSGIRRWDPFGPVTAAGNTVTFDSLPGVPTFGDPVVSYLPPPSDLIGLDGKPVALFAGFPVTLIL